MTTQHLITSYQPLLFSIAYRMVGSVAEAEDLVQDTWMKIMHVDFSKIENVKQYLTRAITNRCITHLQNLRKHQLVNINVSEYLNNLHISSDFSLNTDKLHEIEEAVKRMLEKLSPSERAVFSLREFFNFDYSELTDLMEKKKDNCRQLFKRAKEKLMQEKDEAISVCKVKQETFTESFLKASDKGEVGQFIEMLLKDIRQK
ncbi:sigma-70 family RNA polymerase sigma factor [Sediminitomix flava]|uniref:RNA polymerase sigma-70 factor (ECF subfamily) n=1 Tax=Sediminitomix flava TaxID=379075 RepID=A0A315ZHY2_SEDFL|nr:sigma-70 family RNA polymerase sigma factor [Sediminitomix flava]PWJ44833.1 RNA polymerase sigma-70 factor (ECF subfamily) [Sediminitomix flava]